MCKKIPNYPTYVFARQSTLLRNWPLSGIEVNATFAFLTNKLVSVPFISDLRTMNKVGVAFHQKENMPSMGKVD